MQQEEPALFDELLHVPVNALLALPGLFQGLYVLGLAASLADNLAQGDMEELQEQEMAVGVFLLLDEAHPVAQTFYFADVAPLLLVELAEGHEDLVLLLLVDAGHE